MSTGCGPSARRRRVVIHGGRDGWERWQFLGLEAGAVPRGAGRGGTVSHQGSLRGGAIAGGVGVAAGSPDVGAAAGSPGGVVVRVAGGGGGGSRARRGAA